MNMTKACIVVSDFYSKNRLFDIDDEVSNIDNRLYLFHHLKNELYSNNIDLSTQDINPVLETPIVIFNDMPKIIPAKKEGQKYYLLALECEAIHPLNFKLERYADFDKVFTWKDDIVDGKKIIKINYSFLWSRKRQRPVNDKSRLICLIAYNKRSKHKLELYSERIRAINWFEKYHPEEFELYGFGWEKLHSTNIIDWMAKSVKNRQRMRTKPYSCYHGAVPSKLKTLEQYRFNICYENARDIPGYITEKIFDCLFSGCVPIYRGADNIQEHIPADCFIDRRDFDGYDELYSCIKKMDSQKYGKYIDSAHEYLTSSRSYEFTTEYFAKKIAGEIRLGSLL